MMMATMMVMQKKYPLNMVRVSPCPVHKQVGSNSMHCCRRYTLSSITKAMTAGKDAVAEASSRDLLSDPQCFELFTISPRNKCKAYRYSYGTSLQVCMCMLAPWSAFQLHLA